MIEIILEILGALFSSKKGLKWLLIILITAIVAFLIIFEASILIAYLQSLF